MEPRAEAHAGNDRTPQRRARAKPAKENFVRATTRTLELTRVGHAVDFKVYQEGRLLGCLEVGLGALRWSPAGRRAAETKTIPWKVFATMIRAWPFGEPVKARLKFEKGHLRWRSPGKKGRGSRMTWDEFVRRMEAPLRSVPPYPPAPAPPPRPLPVPGEEPHRATPAIPNQGPAEPEKFAAIHDLAHAARNLRFKAQNGAEIRLRNTGPQGSPGPINVEINGDKKGAIGGDGSFSPSPARQHETPTVARMLRELDLDPKEALRIYGHITGVCAICGRPLTDPESIARGIGPICAAKIE